MRMKDPGLAFRQPVAVGVLTAVLFLTPLVAGASALHISPDEPSTLAGRQVVLHALLHDHDVTEDVSWVSSAPDIAAIDRSGELHALHKGSSTITATFHGQHASTLATVTEVSSIVFQVAPATSSVDSLVTPPIQVVVTDNLGGAVSGLPVTLMIAPNPPNPATLSGGLVQTTDSTGAATFADVRLDYVGTAYKLVATVFSPTKDLAVTSPPFDETRVGDVCLGPTPACSSTCADSDGDGLNDAWELAGGIDLNGDGKITAPYDLFLPGADAHKQDVFVVYDWMDYGTSGNACGTSLDCTAMGAGHAGETCSGPKVVADLPGSCVYSCTSDKDCQGRSRSASTERCMANAGVHTHDPEVVAPGSLDAVVASFAAHGIALHIVRGHAVPHSLVTSFRRNAEFSDAVEGGSAFSGSAGIGKHAVSLYDLKAITALDRFNIAYHYALFAHYSACDTPAHCDAAPAATNPDGSPKNAPTWGQSGLAEISGNDFVISLGNRFQDLGLALERLGHAGTFMHELGHNLGLHHGGGIDTPCHVDADCSGGRSCTTTPVGRYCLNSEAPERNFKPNFLSVMNYRYQFTGIRVASAIGSSVLMNCSVDSDCPPGTLCSQGSCARLDYSDRTLPAGGNTPGALDESNVFDLPASDPGRGLNEQAGLGSGTADLFTFTDAQQIRLFTIGATTGPVDWSGNGDFQSAHVEADLTCNLDHTCPVPPEIALPLPRLYGHTDWEANGKNEFTYKFQCTPYGGPSGDGASMFLPFLQNEITTEMTLRAHVAYPPRAVRAEMNSGCVTAGMPSTALIVVAGADDLDVRDIDADSLNLGGSKPLRISFRDVNGDGTTDLVAEFDARDRRFARDVKHAALTGWLKNSQAFIAQVRATDPRTTIQQPCR